nr:FtsX-like permease family protein [Streptomyces roseirectus]
MKAVGFRTRTVLTLLITEMALTAALSALLAIALGAAASTAATVFLRGDRELAPYLDAGTPLPAAPTLAALLALTVLVVTAGAFVPARRAANLQPAEAMRHW